MDDLISRKAALRTDCFGDGHEGLRAFHSYHDYRLMREYLESLPSTDAVEVVRCKDCAYRYGNACDWADFWLKDDDFCSKGERKESKEPERDTGEWLSHSDFPDRLICSECGAQFDVWHWESEQMHFCPNCGADMRGE